MVEEDRRQAAARPTWTREIRRHVLDPVQIEIPRLEDVAVLLALVALLGADRTIARRQLAEERVQLAAALCGVGGLACLAHRWQQWRERGGAGGAEQLTPGQGSRHEKSYRRCEARLTYCSRRDPK